MTRIVTWFLLSCKRYATRLSFLLILFLLPAAMAVFGALEHGRAREVRIAVYVQGNQDGTLGGRLAERLAGSRAGQTAGDSLFDFYLCRDEQQLKDDVVSRKAECGYVIGENLKARLDSGDYKRCITVYSAPSTVAAKLSTEVVFSVMMELYNKDLLEDYVAKGELFDAIGETGSPKRDAATKKAGELYDTWLGSGATFRFEYASLDTQGNTAVYAGTAATTVFPVRGLVAICLFIIGLYGTVITGMDAENGLFLPLPYRFRAPCRIACIAGPACMAAVSGLAAIWLGGSSQSFLKELGAMAAYLILVVAFSCLLGAICRRPQVLCCLIPFFIIGSLVFCPVILDAGQFFPVFQTVGKLFLPYYYLRWF